MKTDMTKIYNRPGYIRISSLLCKGSIFMGIILTTTLAQWMYSGLIIFNPPLNLMFILMCPIFYKMGEAMDTERKMRNGKEKL